MQSNSLDRLPGDCPTEVRDERLKGSELLRKIEAAERRIQSGEGVPHDRAKEQMQAWLK